VGLGLALVLVAFGLSFWSGVVIGGTTLYLDYSTIQAYTLVGQKTSELTAPYEYLNNLAMSLELFSLVFMLVSAATVHSLRKSLHFAAVVLGPVVMIADMVAKAHYNSLTDQALARLPSLVDSYSLRLAYAAQNRFDAAYGFWAAPAQTLNGLLSLIGLVFLIVAIFTFKVASTWIPSEAQVPQPAVEPEPAHTTIPGKIETRQVASIELKFCRYCGARILRTSKFCEECGKRLA
jgi:hypothetical protein